MRTVVLISFLLTAMASFAQRKGVIVNMSDGVPVRDVKIYTNTNTVATTNWRGEYSIAKYFTSVTITHPDYVSRTLNLYEMSDTLELLPKFHTLDEVIVYGRRPDSFNRRNFMGDIKYFKGPSGMDFLSIFRKHVGLSRKQKERHDEIIRTY